MFKQIFVAALAVAMCLIGLLTGSGIGMAFGIYEKSMAVFLLLFLALPLAKTLVKGTIRLKDLLLFAGLVLVIGLWPLFQGNGTVGIEYGWLLLVPFVIGQIPFSDRDVRIIGLVCGGFSFVVLGSNLFLGVFDGWNPNSIAIAAFLGCALCSGAPWDTHFSKAAHRSFLLLMAFWVLSLDSRSCFFGILPLLCLFSFNIVKPSYALHKRSFRRFFLISPLLIAVFVVAFQNMPIFDVLNELSHEYFGKEIFNGRNNIWEQGLQTFLNNFWLGVGRISGGRWHNAALTILAAYGIIGYLLWISLFDRLMEKACSFGKDQTLCSCAASFLTIMLQQSFELGLVSTQGNILPYFLLGIMLGRVRYLQQHQHQPERKTVS